MADSMCYPDTTDWSCAFPLGADGEPNPGFAELDPVVVARAEAFAWMSLQMLTGYQVATCPITVRPCRRRCNPSVHEEAPVGGVSGFRPGMNAQGAWVNSCGCARAESCSCGPLSEVMLPGPVGAIAEVRIDGEIIAADRYRVDNGNLLVSTDPDLVWPDCQDIAASVDDEGTFAITYYRGAAPDPMTNFAAGKLASEFLKGCTGKKCDLPPGVTNIVRQGVSMEIRPGLWPDGFTGIREVDAVIAIFNPFGQKAPSRVYSPESRRRRETTWGAR